MTYQNKYDRSGKCSANGRNAEQLFIEAFKKRDSEVRSGTKEQNIFGKIDIVSPKYGTFDVKARKKINRQQKNAQDDLIWIEYRNVSGKKGWLFGESDFVAFERESDFVIIPRDKLIKVCQILVNTERYVVEAKSALYKIYQRENRKDMLTMIKMSDILGLDSVEIMGKTNE